MGGAKEERVVVVIYTGIDDWLRYAYTCLFTGVAASVMHRGHAWLETAISLVHQIKAVPNSKIVYTMC